MNPPTPFAALGACALLGACAPIRVETTKPIQVDVNMKVELFQKEAANREGAHPEDKGTPVASSRRNRMAEIQRLKDDRVVGENASGYLSVRDIPDAWKGHEDYIRSLANDDNNDRQLIYATEARRSGKPLAEIEAAFAGRIRERSYKGEWIELPGKGWQRK